MKKVIVLLMCCTLLLYGCSTPVSTQSITAITEGAEGISGTIGDTSLAKEAVIIRGWVAYYKAMKEIHKNSGLDITTVMFEAAPGVFVQVNSRTTYREFIALPTPPEKPSVHPVWDFGKSVIGNIVKGALIGYGIHEAAGVLTAGLTAAGSTYNGPVTGSYNKNSGSGTQSVPYKIDNTDNSVDDNSTSIPAPVIPSAPPS